MRLSNAIIQDLEQILNTNPNVVGYSATTKYKLSRGKELTKAIRIYVARALPKGKVNPKLRVPRTIQGFPVDVEVMGKVHITESGSALQKVSKGAKGHIERYVPLQGGISVFNAKVKLVGTLGYFFRDEANPPAPKKPDWYLLSNRHVLYDKGAPDEAIQPSLKDGGQYPHDVVGELTDDKLTEEIDAAIAKIDIGAVAEIVDVTPPPTNKVVTEDMVQVLDAKGKPRNPNAIMVRKSGRTTGMTDGWITDAHYRGTVGDPKDPNRMCKDCLLIRSLDPDKDFVLGGDSGSLLVDANDHTALGLIFAEGPFEKNVGAKGIACRMEKVLAAFPGKIMVKPGESWP